MPAIEDVIPDVLKVIGGVAVGWLLRSAIGLQASTSSSGSGGGGKKKKAAAGSSGAAAVRSRIAVPRPREELKMVLCVNTGLGMGKGKIGAQCAHAAVGIMERYRSRNEVAFRQWESHGQPKIALKVKDEEEMAQLAAKAQQAGLMCYIVHDAGRTQIAAGSQTVLAVGPAPKSDIDRVTGHLSLL